MFAVILKQGYRSAMKYVVHALHRLVWEIFCLMVMMLAAYNPVDRAVRVNKLYVSITAYGFTLTAEAVGGTPNSFSFSLPSLMFLHSL